MFIRPEDYPDELRPFVRRMAGPFPYLEHGPGWFPLLIQLEPRLATLCPEYQLLQVKEKFGTLRIYPAALECDSVSEFLAEIAAAERASEAVCEDCGSPGKLTCEHGCYLTRCTPCLEAWKNGKR
jgi:hypothetical protein